MTVIMSLGEAIAQPFFRETTDFLANYKIRTDAMLSSAHLSTLARLKKAAVDRDDQITAKAAWCLETIGEIQDHFISAFQCMRSGKFVEAWGNFARCEVGIEFLTQHFDDKDVRFGINYIELYTNQFQELFNAGWGVSPEILIKRKLCSICHAPITPRSKCDHRPGEVYDGAMCVAQATDWELIAVALVPNPVQKTSVIFPHGNDDSRFYLLRFLMKALDSPWHGWTYQKEDRREHHPEFKNVGRNDKCPCGSGIKYKYCCIRKEFVFPHFQFTFEVQPQIAVPSYEYHRVQNC